MDKNYFSKWLIKSIIFIGHLIILMVAVRKELYTCNLAITDLTVVGISQMNMFAGKIDFFKIYLLHISFVIV